MIAGRGVDDCRSLLLARRLDRRDDCRADDPRGVVRRHFVRIVSGKIERVVVRRERRNPDRPRRHQRPSGRCGDLVEVVTSGRVPHYVPAAGFEAAVPDVDDIVTGGYRRG
jgi:hypothetical protein